MMAFYYVLCWSKKSRLGPGARSYSVKGVLSLSKNILTLGQGFFRGGTEVRSIILGKRYFFSIALYLLFGWCKSNRFCE